MTIPHHLMFLRDDVRWWYKLAFIAVLVFFPLHARTAEAASLNLNPAAKAISIGGEFAVSVVVNSAGQNMNAASGVVSFPSDKLQVVSLSKSGSIFSLWVQEPSFSNAAGTVNFEGIVLNPGFTGSGGKIITINFKSKSAGEANIVFSSGEILANDGKGTNILGKLGGSLISISPTAGTAVPPSAQSLQPPTAALSSLGAGGLAPQPQISSPTHPEQDGWYNNNSPKFTWQVPQGVTAVRLSYDQDAKAVPWYPIVRRSLKNC
jgi:hypothetical protein